ncbi:MAG: DUF6364 family protein [Saprospiraceae bacterium]
MSNKLTLSIDQVVIAEAKEYAKSEGKSLSNIVEEYLKSLSSNEHSDQKKISLKIVKELKGSIKMPKDFISYQETLQDALLEKYLGE